MSEQQRLDNINQKRAEQLFQYPKAFYQLLSFMDAHIKKHFRSFSIFNICSGTSHKLRFNDPNFQRAFEALTLEERLDLYEKAVDYGVVAFGGNEKRTKDQLDQVIDEQVKQLLPEGSKEFLITLHHGLGSGQDVQIRIQKFKLSAKSHFTIKLQNYLLRQSKKKAHNVYIFEVVNKTTPQKIRFSFPSFQEQAENLPLIEKMTDLAFRSTINAMIVPELTSGFSPKKSGMRETLTRQSVGRLADPPLLQELPISSSTKLQKIIDGRSVLQFSAKLAQKKRQAQRQKVPRSNSEIIQQLLSSRKLSQQQKQEQNSPTSEMQAAGDNIFRKVLETQGAIKQPYNQPLAQSVQSPINKFNNSQVESVNPTFKQSQNRHKNVFQLMLPQFNLSQFQPSLSSQSFKQIFMTTTNNNNNFTIYQHKLKPQRFKLQLQLQSLNIQQVYNVLINQQLLKKWNQCVDQSQIKITLSAENCLICYQKHKRYSSWFKERDYLFMRHAFTYKKCKYIADRSIEHNSFIPFQSIQRGYIRHCVTRLRQINNNKLQLTVDISVDHGGYLGADKKKQLNLTYLKQYEKLQNYLKKNKSSIVKTSYCDLNWNIDWIDSTDKSVPNSLVLEDEEFLDGEEIVDWGEDGDVELQSDQFYSVRDEEEKSEIEGKQPQQFNFETTAGFQQKEAFNKKKLIEKQLIDHKPPTQEEEKQISPRQQQQNLQVSTMMDTSIILDDEGYCILPQKYFKRKHPIKPKQNYHEQRIREYDNIVMKGDFVVDKEIGILLVNKPKIEAQDNVLKFVMKTMRKNLLSGKSILSISLPVEIFKADSNTQRLCESMTMGPYLLEKAVKATDLQRMKWAVCFGLSNSLLYFYIDKPFNPILGETYQAMIDGCPIYAEQTSHHPPITTLYFVGRGYRVYVSLQSKVFLHINSGDGVNAGYYTIEFDDGGKIRFQTASGEVSGFTIGDRKYRFKDKMYVYDKKNCLFSVLNFDDPDAGFFSKGKWTLPDQMGGQILKVTPAFIQKFQQSQQKILPKPKQIVSTVSKMQGRWLYYLNFDGQKYYDIVNDLPYKLVNYEYALNSDAKYREDLIYRSKNDTAKSQIYKEYLENKQRKDRKLREQYNGKQH